HGGQEPPQSIAVSLPFWSPSVHDTSAQTEAPGEQTKPSPQSASPTQPSPTPQPRAQLPPQSWPVSSPFCTPSSQLGASGTGGTTPGQSSPMHGGGPASALCAGWHAPSTQRSPVGHGTAVQHATPPSHAPASGVGAGPG